MKTAILAWLMIATLALGQGSRPPEVFTSNTIIRDPTGLVVTPPAIYFAGKFAYATDDHIDFHLAKNESTGTLANQSIYSTLTHTGGGTYVRDSNCWLRGDSSNGLVNLTPIAVYNSWDVNRGIILVSPRHFISYGNSMPPNGTTIRFVTNTNTIVSRTVSSSSFISVGLGVGKLDSDVPNTIAFVKVLPASVSLKSQIGRVLAFVTMTDQKVWTADEGNPNLTTGLTIAGKSAYLKRSLGYKTIGYPVTSDDAGAPYLYVFDRELVFAGTANEDTDGFWSASFKHTQINTAMTSLGGGYQLTDYTSTVLPPRPPTEISYIFGLTNPYGGASVLGGVNATDSNGKTVLDVTNYSLGRNAGPVMDWSGSAFNFSTTPKIGGDPLDVALGLSNYSYNDLSNLTEPDARNNIGLSDLSGVSDPTNARINLGLAIGTNVQAYDIDLVTWAGITPGTGVGTFLTTPSGTNLAAALTTPLPTTKGGTGLTSLGTGVATALGVNVGSAGAVVTFNGALGTPSSGVATNLTGTASGLTAGTASAVAVGGITGLGTGIGTFLATPSGANLASALTTALSVSKGGTAGTSIITGWDSLATKGADIASASTTDLSTTTGYFVNVTGTTTINSFGTMASGTRRMLKFTGTGTITHNGTSLILNGANKSRAANDYAEFESLGSGNWRCVWYMDSNGKSLGAPTQDLNTDSDPQFHSVQVGTPHARAGGTIFTHFTDTSTTSTDGSEDQLYDDTLAASTLGTNGDSITEVEHVKFVSSATAARRLKKYFASTLIFDSGSLTLTLGGDFTLETTIIRESASVVRCDVAVTSTSASSVPYSTFTRITGLTLSASYDLETDAIASGTGAASGDILDKMARITWFPAP